MKEYGEVCDLDIQCDIIYGFLEVFSIYGMERQGNGNSLIKNTVKFVKRTFIYV